MLSFRTMGDKARMEGLTARIGFAIGAERFLLVIDGGMLTVDRGPIDGADAVFTGPAPLSPAPFMAESRSKRSRRKARSMLEGDRGLAERFVTLFPLPPKAGQAATGRGLRSSDK